MHVFLPQLLEISLRVPNVADRFPRLCSYIIGSFLHIQITNGRSKNVITFEFHRIFNFEDRIVLEIHDT